MTDDNWMASIAQGKNLQHLRRKPIWEPSVIDQSFATHSAHYNVDSVVRCFTPWNKCIGASSTLMSNVTINRCGKWWSVARFNLYKCEWMVYRHRYPPFRNHYNDYTLIGRFSSLRAYCPLFYRAVYSVHLLNECFWTFSSMQEAQYMNHNVHHHH